MNTSRRSSKGKNVRRSKELDLKVRDRVARPYFGPYRVLNVTQSNVEVRLVDKPTKLSIFVFLDRVRVCNPKLGDVSWSDKVIRKKKVKVSRNVANKMIVECRFEGWVQSHAHRLARCIQTKTAM